MVGTSPECRGRSSDSSVAARARRCKSARAKAGMGTAGGRASDLTGRRLPMAVNVTREEQPGIPDEQAYMPGDVIANKYLLVRQAGEGAMGTVWLALNTAINLRVAIKLIH